MRELELSRPSRMLPLSWSLARVSSSSGSELFLQLAEFVQDQVDGLQRLAGRGAGVDAERAGVAVGAQVGIDGVGQAALFADGLEEARAHAAAQDRVQDQGGVAVFVGDGRGGHAQADLHLLQRLFCCFSRMRALEIGRGEFVDGLAAVQRREFLGHGLDEAVVVEIAGGGEDHVAGVEAAGVVVEELVLVEPGRRSRWCPGSACRADGPSRSSG